MWDDFAHEADINLIAPDSNNEAGWPLGQATADYLEAVLDDAAATYSIDPDQIYLFGHSAGAGVAQYLANRTDGPWRAVATHAGALSASEVRQKPGAIPIYSFLGDQDPLVPTTFAQESAEALSNAGHRVELITMPHHGHWYYHIGPYMAERVWDRLVSAQDSASHSY
nr:dienelactone hydrolase family protein [Cochlodiniinecator piscidefendens]